MMDMTNLPIKNIRIIASRDSTKALKDGEDTKKKTYTALCVIPKEKATIIIMERLSQLQDMKSVELSQRTPIRVLHRR